jgi:hypothetical protein
MSENRFGQLLLIAGEFYTSKLNIWKVEFGIVKKTTVKRVDRALTNEDLSSTVCRRTVRAITDP